MSDQGSDSDRTKIVVAVISGVTAIIVAYIGVKAGTSHPSSEPSQVSTTAAQSSASAVPTATEPSPAAVLTSEETALFDRLSPERVNLSTCLPFPFLEQHGASGALECNAIPPLSQKLAFGLYPSTEALDEQGMGAYSGGESGNGSCAKGGFSTGTWDLADGSLGGDQVCIENSGIYDIASGFNSSAILVVVEDKNTQHAYTWYYNYVNSVLLN